MFWPAEVDFLASTTASSGRLGAHSALAFLHVERRECGWRKSGVSAVLGRNGCRMLWCSLGGSGGLEKAFEDWKVKRRRSRFATILMKPSPRLYHPLPVILSSPGVAQNRCLNRPSSAERTCPRRMGNERRCLPHQEPDPPRPRLLKSPSSSWTRVIVKRAGKEATARRTSGTGYWGGRTSWADGFHVLGRMERSQEPPRK